MNARGTGSGWERLGRVVKDVMDARDELDAPPPPTHPAEFAANFRPPVTTPYTLDSVFNLRPGWWWAQ